MPSINVRLTQQEVETYFQPAYTKRTSVGRLDWLASKGFPLTAHIEMLEYTVQDSPSAQPSEGPLVRVTYDDIPVSER